MEDEQKDITLYDKKLNKTYIPRTYIQKDYIVFDIESDSDKFSKQFKLDDLKMLSEYFNMSNDLESGLSDLNDLIREKYSIEENEESFIIIYYFRRRNIKFILDKIDDNINISYDSLSDIMKKIIDEDRLILGIDLGTTYSCASVIIDKNIIMTRNSLGLTTTPSYISFMNKNEAYVGELAKLLPSNERNVIFNIKRLLGKSIEDNEIKELIKKLPFTLKKDEKYNILKISLDFLDKEEEEEFYPEQICALILKKIVKDSEFYLTKKIGKKITIKNSVITVPAYFNQKQREATKYSAEILGLKVQTMINEPTAASLAYAFESLENTEKKIIVIDFGGGTLDITLLRYKKDENAVYCDVKFTYGDTNFGGEDFDNILMEKCLKECKQITGNESLIFFDNSKKNANILRLKRACERAKIKLSAFNSTKIHINNYQNYKGIDIIVKKKDFINDCKKLFEKFEKILDDFIMKAKINKDDKFEIILTGGTTLIPEIRKKIAEKFNKSIIKSNLDPKEVVARGAAIRGAKFLNLPLVSDITLFDVTNLSLGIRTKGNIFDILIPRSTPIPYNPKDNGIFCTVKNNQTEALIQVFEGEKIEDCDLNNLLLGKFRISGFPQRKAGEVKIEENIRIKDNSIIEVTAFEADNKSNRKVLIIDKLNDFAKIIDSLRNRGNSITLFETSKYNQIKFSIIEYEEDIAKQRNKKKINEQTIKLAFKSIIENIGNFLINYSDYSNLYTSFIKYYFKKMCEFFQIYQIKDDKFLEAIKKNITILFEKIQFYDRDLIFEIIEEFVDEEQVFKNFVDLIIQSLWDDINTIFFLVKIKNNRDFNKEIIELSKAKSLTDICVEMIDKYDKDKTKLNNITKIMLEYMKIKIEVREEIIKYKNKNFYQKIFFDKVHLNDLYYKYYDCPSVESEDLKELGQIIGNKKINNQKFYENFDEDWKKAERFIQRLQNDKNEKNDNIYMIYNILSDYPYDKDNTDNMWTDFNKFKSGKYTKENYLDIIKKKYRDIMDSGKLSELEEQVINSILEYFNNIKW